MFTCCNDHRLPSPQQACTLWKCSTESWRLSKVLCWCRHSFPSRFHDPSCTTITLKSSQATKTKAIISHILERKTEEGNEREREREKMFMLEAEASTCWVVGVQEKKLCVRYFAWFSFHWSGAFPPDLLWSTYFYRSSFQCYYTSEQTQAFATCISWFQSLSHPTPADKRHEGEHKIAQDWQDWQQQRSASGSSDVACCQGNSSDA